METKRRLEEERKKVQEEADRIAAVRIYKFFVLQEDSVEHEREVV